MVAAIFIRAVDQPGELNAFIAEPEIIHSGSTVMFKFVFNTPMDTSANPIMHLNMRSEANVSFPTVWSDVYTCSFSYEFPNIRENGTAEITLTGAVTRDGKAVDEVHAAVKVISGPNPGTLIR